MTEIKKSEFKPFYVRQDVIGRQFSFMIADPIAKSWYGGDLSPISRETAITLGVSESASPSEWFELEILRDHIALPGSVVVECGSHHGLTTVLLSSFVGESGFVYAFDAVHENISTVRENLAINAITNVSAMCAGIGGRFGMMRMQNESNVILTEAKENSPYNTIIVRLSSLFQKPPDAIKIDIEGSELELLEADKEFIASIPRLAIEVHTDLLPPDGIDRLLAAIGSRPLHILKNDKMLSEYNGESITERVHLFSW